MMVVMSERVPTVPATVREAFELDGAPVPLGGGEGVTVRLGGVVLKRVHDVDEAEWSQALQFRMGQHGFRLAGTGHNCGRSPWRLQSWQAAPKRHGNHPTATASARYRARPKPAIHPAGSCAASRRRQPSV
jgi:hypothetical protein